MGINVTESLTRITYENTAVCQTGFNYLQFMKDLFLFFLLPLAVCLFLYLLISHSKKMLDLYYKLIGKRNFVFIGYLYPNSDLIIKKTFLDKFDNFKIKKKTYTLQDMKEFVIGYYQNTPFFLYDNNFILPLKKDRKTLEEEIILQYKLNDKSLEERVKTINAIMLKIKPNVLNMVYDNKLLHDLYMASSSSDLLNNPVIKYGLIALGLAVLYYTGLLDQIMKWLGI